MAQGFTLFETAIGRCGIAWSETHVLAVRLPARDDATTAASLRKHAGALPFATTPAAIRPPFVTKAIASIRAHLSGENCGNSDDLNALPLDFSRLGVFDRSVLTACREIPAGKTRTYGDIAKSLGDPQAARAVGAALGRNPWPIVVPCHRVVAANGKLGGFSAPGGRTSKIKLLEIEGAAPNSGPTLFDAAAT